MTTPNVTLENISTATGPQLVAFYNAHPSTALKPIKKFVDRATAIERVTRLLKADAGSAAPAPKSEPKLTMNIMTGKLSVKRAAPTAMQQMAATIVKDKAPAKSAPAKKTKAAKPAKAPSAGGKRLFTEAGIITVLHKGENPKRGTAAERYALYRNGMTVAAYIAAGGQRRDVVWDQHQGWISVKG